MTRSLLPERVQGVLGLMEEHRKLSEHQKQTNEKKHIMDNLWQKPEPARGGFTPCFLFRNTASLPQRTPFHKWMKLSEGESSKCIYTVVTLHGVDLKKFTTAGHVCVRQLHAFRAPPRQHQPAKQIRRETSETPC